MHQDIWCHVIEFSHPIDVFASLIGVNRSIYQLVEKSFVELDQILKCDENCFGCKISISNFNEKDEMNKIKLIGNSKYFIRMYLLHLAFRLGDVNPSKEESNSNFYSKVEQELELLNFYRSTFSPDGFLHNQDIRIHSNNEFILNRYMLLGDARIGKTTLSNALKYGNINEIHHSNTEFISKKFRIRGEEEWKHEIVDTFGRELYYSCSALLKQLEVFKILNLVICFSMKSKKSLDGIENWFDTVDDHGSVSCQIIRIIIGLYPNVEVTEMVNPIDAVKKAFTCGKSIFAQVNSKEMKNVFLPFWFIHLLFNYFHKIPKISKAQLEEKQSNNEGNSKWCTLI